MRQWKVSFTNNQALQSKKSCTNLHTFAMFKRTKTIVSDCMLCAVKEKDANNIAM